MLELLRSPNIVLVHAVEALLGSAAIPCLVADRHMAALEGGILAFPLRVLVPEEDFTRALRLVRDAGFGSELPCAGPAKP